MTQVSIITVTQCNRFENLKNLYHIIQRQQYVQIKEWVIVEGSQTIEQRHANSQQILHFIREHEETTDIDMRLIVPKTILPLSNLRNIGNNSCKGDIIVCMDDDDYYPPTRVFHAVTMLTRYDSLIAGCSKMYMYDYYFEKLYKFRGYHNNHSTNNCMAFKREYLINHHHAEGLNMAEEYSFTNGFTEPMIQLNPENCIVVSSHDYNTFSKKEIICNNDKYYHANNDDNNDNINDGSAYNIHLYEVKDTTISKLIPADIFQVMKSLFSNKK